jgi:hypothetical protein
VPVNQTFYDVCKPTDLFSVIAESTKVFVATLEEPRAFTVTSLCESITRNINNQLKFPFLMQLKKKTFSLNCLQAILNLRFPKSSTLFLA